MTTPKDPVPSVTSILRLLRDQATWHERYTEHEPECADGRHDAARFRRAIALIEQGQRVAARCAALDDARSELQDLLARQEQAFEQACHAAPARPEPTP